MEKKNWLIKLWNGVKLTLGFIQNNFKALLFLLIIYIIFSLSGSDTTQNANLMRIDLKGVITNADSVSANIERAYLNDNIRGVLLVVDSPGGAVAPSIEISMAVKRLASKKPVVAYAAGTMASGSYYAASTADYIISNPGSLIGSIGVIMQAPNFQHLADKIGVGSQVVKAGAYKEAGTVTREWTKEERSSLQELVDDTYKLFVSDIAKARKLDMNKSAEFADARVFIASKAQQIGLIDEVGSLNDAAEKLKALSNVTQEVWQKPDIIERIADKIAAETKAQVGSLFYGTMSF